MATLISCYVGINAVKSQQNQNLLPLLNEWKYHESQHTESIVLQTMLRCWCCWHWFVPRRRI